jgi:hypothetical protein
LIPKEFGMKIKVRLLGVRMSHLERVSAGDDDDDEAIDHDAEEHAGRQLELMVDGREQRIKELTHAVDAIRNKFGEHSIKLAGTMRSPS